PSAAPNTRFPLDPRQRRERHVLRILLGVPQVPLRREQDHRPAIAVFRAHPAAPRPDRADLRIIPGDPPRRRERQRLHDRLDVVLRLQARRHHVELQHAHRRHDRLAAAAADRVEELDAALPSICVMPFRNCLYLSARACRSRAKCSGWNLGIGGNSPTSSLEIVSPIVNVPVLISPTTSPAYASSTVSRSCPNRRIGRFKRTFRPSLGCHASMSRSNLPDTTRKYATRSR